MFKFMFQHSTLSPTCYLESYAQSIWNVSGYLFFKNVIKCNVFYLTSVHIYIYIFQLQPSPSSCCWRAWTVLPIRVSTCFSPWSPPNCWEPSCAWNTQTWRSHCLRRLRWSALCIWALKATLTYDENETTLYRHIQMLWTCTILVFFKLLRSTM